MQRIMRHTLPIAACLLAAALAGRAVALEPHQAEAIDRLAAAPPQGKSAAQALAAHYAVLLWVEDYCNGRSDEAVRNRLSELGTKDPDAFEKGWMDTFDMLSKTDAQAMCTLAQEQYGPDGALIKGAWARR